ncbi:MAG: mechanosensitive ion channel [Nitrososphaerota archaeon]|nr:mechanosensitive ion channel family protein [Candidatus Bathyarchaeota archaeon]MCX8162898.1 mechanosensitive ion channel family protein [Candidatus Bathyarchaeota archaeon]MDW8061541.1 mechanosensitive ion channel [Nitrososphaerota archaeon]
MSRVREEKPSRMSAIAIAKLICVITSFIVSSAIIQYIIVDLLPRLNVDISAYKIYIDISLSLLFGYLIVHSFSSVVYWSLRTRYTHPVAASVRSIIRILGVGVMVSVISGALTNPTAGVALGGFIGMVVGFASQNILSQVLAGLFVLISRPIAIGELVELGGAKGVVEDISTLFTWIRTDDGRLILIPNNAVIGQRIIKYP